MGEGHTSAGLTVSSFAIGTVADTAGNVMTSTTLPAASSIFGSKTIVIDTTSPSINAITTSAFSWGPVLNSTEDNSDGTVSVTTLGVENGQTVTLTLNGETYSNNVTNNATNVTISKEGLQGLTDGQSYSLTANVSDAAGNDATQVTSSYFTVDKTLPTLSNVSIVSNNNTPTHAKIGDVITLTFTASKEINQPNVTFTSGGDDITDDTITYADEPGNIWTATYTANANDTDGAVTFIIAFSDIAGNAGADVTSGTGSVTFDKTSPTLSNVSIVSNNSINTHAVVDDEVTLTFTASEVINQPNVTFTSGGDDIADSITYADEPGNIWTAKYIANEMDTAGEVAFSIAFSDIAGNAGVAVTSGSGSVTFDKTVPLLTDISIMSNNDSITTLAKENDEVILTFTANETISDLSVIFTSGGADIADTDITYNSSGNIWTVVYIVNANDTDGEVAAAVSYSDTAGNDTSQTINTSFRVDQTAPSINAITTDAFSWAAALNLTDDNNDGTVSVTTVDVEDGQTVTLTLNGSTYTNTITSNATTITISAADLQAFTHGQSYTLTADVSDAVGNDATQLTSSSFTVDKIAPSIKEITTNHMSWGAELNPTEDNNDGIVIVYTSGVEDGQTLTLTLNGSNYSNNVINNATVVTISAAGLQGLNSGQKYSLIANVSDAAGNAADQVVSDPFMITRINLTYVQYGNRYLAHLTCFSGNCPSKRIVRTMNTSTNTTTLTKAQSHAIMIRTRGRGGSRPKTSKKINIYKTLLSLNDDAIRSLLYTFGYKSTSCYITKMARSNLSNTTIVNMKEVYQNILDNLSDVVKEYLSNLCN